MTDLMSTTLSYRPRGTSAWVDVDPASKTGRRIMAALGFITSPIEEIEMSTATANRLREPHIALVPPVDATPTQKGWWHQLWALGAKAWDYLTTLPRRMWNAVTSNPVVEQTGNWFSRAWSWVKAKAVALFRAAGFSGSIGAGLTLVSTDAGRTALGWLFAPVRWGWDAFWKVWNWGAGAVSNLGKPGRWFSERMLDVDHFVNDPTDGIVTKVADFWSEKVAPWIGTNTWLMSLARALGLVMLTVQAPVMIALLPLGVVSVPAVYLGTTAMAIGCAFAVLDAGSRSVKMLEAATSDLSDGLTRQDALWAAYTGPNALVVVEPSVEVVAQAAGSGTPPPRPTVALSLTGASNRSQKRAAAKAKTATPAVPTPPPAPVPAI